MLHRRGFGLSSGWPSAVNLLLGLWLFLSPWILGMGSAPSHGGRLGNATWDAWLAGLAVMVFAAISLLSDRAASRVSLALGAWILIAPWVLGFAAPGSSIAWAHWATGALIVILSVIRVSGTRQTRVGASTTSTVRPRPAE